MYDASHTSANTRPTRGRSGYLRSLAGGLAGAAVGGGGDYLMSWLAGWLDADPGAGMANLVLGLVFWISMTTAIWLGQVVGVWVALKARGHDGAGLTAAGTALLTGIVAFVAWWTWALPILSLAPLMPAAGRHLALGVLTRPT